MQSIKRLIYYNKYFLSFMEGKRTKEAQGPLIQQSEKLGKNFAYKPKPEFLEARLKQFAQIKKRIDEIYEKADKPQITITLKDGKELKGQAFLSTPYSIAKTLSKNLAENSIVARIKYIKRYESPLSKGVVAAEVEEEGASFEKNQGFELVDMSRPIEGDCVLQLISFDDKEGKQVFWHSSAHLLGQSLENNYGAWLCHGPPLAKGFFYDSFIGDYKVSQDDYDKIQKEVKTFVQQKQPFERILLNKKEALQMFAYNPFKTQLIQSKIPEDGLTSAYRCGNLIDLCTGPHIASADKVKGFKVTKNSSAYWLGKKQNDDLQRVYALSYPKQSQLDEQLEREKELAKRDHRNIGPKQGLFNFTTLSPGCALFFPHGTVIYNRLIELMRSQYRIRGYSEVLSPNIYNSELWKRSGHYFKYSENIYFIDIDDDQYGLKPMNCPGHCIMFDTIQRSYKELPLRMADFGVLHRNQLHGALSGLTRVRRFQQDDAHIFCTRDQIEQEILGVLDLLDYIYSVFGFKYVLELSTRPEKFLGDIQDWNKAQAQLKNALEQFGKEYKLNPGDGAFYGPKIDIKLFDAFDRTHQCGTVQLDFQLPLRFNLQYRAKGKHEQEQQKKAEQQQTKQGDKKEKEKKKKGEKGEKGEKIQITPEERERLKKEKLQRKAKEEADKLTKKEEKQQKKEEQVKAEKTGHFDVVEKKEQQPIVNKRQETIEEMEERYSKIGNLKNGFERPVIIHRAIFGSLERFIAILCEHTGGKWDFWVSPRQVQIIPKGVQANDFANQVYNSLLLQGYSVSIDNSEDKFNAKIRNAQLQGYNYIAVIGPAEVKEQSITLRKRDDDKFEKYTVQDAIKLFESMKPPKSKRRIILQKGALQFQSNSEQILEKKE